MFERKKSTGGSGIVLGIQIPRSREDVCVLASFENLPTDVLLGIAQFLSIKEVCFFSQVASWANEISSLNEIWGKFIFDPISILLSKLGITLSFSLKLSAYR